MQVNEIFLLVLSLYLFVCDLSFSFQYTVSRWRLKVCSNSFPSKNLTPKLRRLSSVQFLSTSDEEVDSSGSENHYQTNEEGVDMFGDIPDEAVLEKYRIQKLLDNDRWQMSLMEDLHCGSWIGFYEVLTPSTDSLTGDVMLRKVAAGTVFSDYKKVITDNKIIAEENYQMSFEDKNHLPSHDYESLTSVTNAFYTSDKFRVSEGNQFVGNGFTVVSTSEQSSGDKLYIAEEGVRIGNMRTRARFLYHKHRADPAIATLIGLCLIREIASNAPEMQATETVQELFHMDKVGLGIFDPQVQGEKYVDITLPGRLSLLFPTEIKEREKTSLTMEWMDNTTRYQIDRIFSSIDKGEIQTLELTEVKVDDAVTYTALHPERPPFLL